MRRKNLRKKYPLRCPGCGKKFHAAPSIGMGMGINRGVSECPKCKTFFLLKITGNLFGECMVTKKFLDQNVWLRNLVWINMDQSVTGALKRLIMSASPSPK